MNSGGEGTHVTSTVKIWGLHAVDPHSSLYMFLYGDEMQLLVGLP
jgi:hypothetical protein